jgi:hypothetical protein
MKELIGPDEITTEDYEWWREVFQPRDEDLW